MTLGKFRFVTSTGGQSLLVRDAEDIVGFDREMRTHVERDRRETGFLEFNDKTVHGREGKDDYFVPPDDVVAYQVKKPAPLVDYAPSSYAIHFFSPGPIPGRWPETRMSSVLAQAFFKNSAQSASGQGDGGVGIITSALAAWTNDCASYANWAYAGTNALLKNNDGVNTFLWNDPGGDITGPWTGSGVIARAYMNANAFHTFNGEVNGWWSFSDCDVVVQNGLTGSESFIPTAITHEIGHCTALRHSNTHHDGSACQGTDECTGSAVMNSSVVSAYLYNLQPWDQNAIRDLYPGSCCSAPAITSQPSPSTIVTGQSATMTVAATGTAPFSYQWYAGNSADTSTPVPGGTSSSLTVTLTTTTSYWVRVTNSCGTADSNTVTVTVTVNTPSAATKFYGLTPCRVVDTRDPIGPSGGPSLVAGGVRNLAVAGVCGIPTGAVAVAVNLVVIAPGAGGYMTLYPGPIASELPLAATINYQTGRILGNNAVVRVGSDSLNVYNGGSTAVHYVIDVTGYFQ